MKDNARKLSAAQLAAVIKDFPWHRSITAIHVVQSQFPNHGDTEGDPTLEAIHDRHTQQLGLLDTAQHLSITVEGAIWTGRGWNNPPATTQGHNGDLRSGPISISLIGDFRKDRDELEADQLQQAAVAIALFLKDRDLPLSAVKFPPQLGRSQFLHDDGIDYGILRSEIEAALKKSPKAANSTKTIESIVSSLSPLLPGIEFEKLSLPPLSTPADAERGIFKKHKWSKEEIQVFRKHVVNMSRGKLQSSGSYETTEAHIRDLCQNHLPDAFAKAKRNGKPLRILLYAHGGLVSEKGALEAAYTYSKEWTNETDAHIYPIFFVWETGFLESLYDIIDRRSSRSVATERGFSDITDRIIEAAAHLPGEALWSKMKEVAEISSSPEGAATLFAQYFVSFTKQFKKGLELYACGHSAGSIFHAHLLPRLSGLGAPEIKDLFLLAPAIRTDEFLKRLEPQIGPDRAIRHLSYFTMTDKYERDDTVGGGPKWLHPYRKSLLYLVSYACETHRATPILGLQKDIQKDRTCRKLLGLDGPSLRGETIYSVTDSSHSRSSSQSETHGGFDNDPATLISMFIRMTGHLPSSDFAQIAAVPKKKPKRRPKGNRPRSVTGEESASGNKRALCIGIDTYSGHARLHGCVNDAVLWQEKLEELDFEVTSLHNDEASRDGIFEHLEELITTAKPGDSIVFQYAGHGTYIEDTSGDEKEVKEDDVYDEALVPHDYEDGSLVLDDDIAKIIDKLADGVSLTIFFDCCHSSTSSRAVFAPGRPPIGSPAVATGELSRFLPLSPEIVTRHQAKRNFERSTGRASVHSLEKMKEVTFSACDDLQTAKEFQGQGYFTGTVCKILIDSVGKLTHREFHEQIVETFPPQVANQDPSLFCREEDRDAILLGGASASLAVNERSEPMIESDIDVNALIYAMNDLLEIVKQHTSTH